MNKKVIIYDFDGTIADTIEAGIQIFNGIARERGYREITDENREDLREKGIQHLLKKLGVPRIMLPYLVMKARRELTHKIADLKPFENIKTVITTVRSNGTKQGLVTSNSPENVTTFLELNDMTNFDYIKTGSSLFGKAKRIKELMNEQDFLPDDVVYVGDETRDIEAARKLGIEIISVTWGANNKNALSSLRPDHLVETPTELLKVLIS